MIRGKDDDDEVRSELSEVYREALPKLRGVRVSSVQRDKLIAHDGVLY